MKPDTGAKHKKPVACSSIIYGGRANIKFSNCKIDASSSSSLPPSSPLYDVSIRPSRRHHPLPLSLFLISRSGGGSLGIPSSFYCKATPHIVQGRVIHFLPAQLFINCCSLGRRTRPTCHPLSPSLLDSAFSLSLSLMALVLRYRG